MNCDVDRSPGRRLRRTADLRGGLHLAAQRLEDLGAVVLAEIDHTGLERSDQASHSVGRALLAPSSRRSDRSVAGTATLTVSNVFGGDTGSYILVITNSAGSMTSVPPTVLTVVDPALLREPVSQTSLPGLPPPRRGNHLRGAKLAAGIDRRASGRGRHRHFKGGDGRAAAAERVAVQGERRRRPGVRGNWCSRRRADSSPHGSARLRRDP